MIGVRENHSKNPTLKDKYHLALEIKYKVIVKVSYKKNLIIVLCGIDFRIKTIKQQSY